MAFAHVQATELCAVARPSIVSCVLALVMCCVWNGLLILVDRLCDAVVRVLGPDLMSVAVLATTLITSWLLGQV